MGRSAQSARQEEESSVFESVLIANRGVSARRVIRSAQRLGLKAVAVHSEMDTRAAYVREADEAVLIGPGPAEYSYLDAAVLLEAARQSGAEAVHPGYGFLAESPDFALRVQDAGLAWVGSSAEVLARLADREPARELAASLGLPVAGHGPPPPGDPAAGGPGDGVRGRPAALWRGTGPLTAPARPYRTGREPLTGRGAPGAGRDAAGGAAGGAGPRDPRCRHDRVPT
jgi:acetyl-CoA carboxylase, biotin carboxylase subunit